MPIRRLLVANRGEIALRIIGACRELGIETVAVHSDVDAQSPHALAADRSIAIGPAPAAQSYLSIPRVIEAAKMSGADAIHPGYGFLSENGAFADACSNAGIVFVGPPAAVIARMGSKIASRRLASAAGVAIVPGETPTDQSDVGVRTAAERVGLPAMVKASAGGGGKGMRIVRDPREIAEAIQAARREATAAFGDGTLYVERLIERPHHVEVQVFGDDHGRTVHLFERDCSVQRRHQKVIEESPSPILTVTLRDRMTTAAVAVARAAEYRNAGTVEFLVDVSQATDRSPFYFLEMNTRLQVEHPVTEQVTGLDLVRAQLLVASGEPLPWSDGQLSQRGHAIEARIYAEDPARGFIPQAGRLVEYRAPSLPGVRIDSGVTEGSEITIYYDPMIAKVIATAENRWLAVNRLAAALRAFRIRGVKTNVPFLLGILDLDAFRQGRIDTGLLDREGARLVESLRDESPPPPFGPSREVRADLPSGAHSGFLAHVQSPIPYHEGRRGIDPWTSLSAHPPTPSPQGPRTRHSGAGQTSLTAPMPATVLKVAVKAGDSVKKGDLVVLLEAMKMELPLRAPADAVISSVRCHEGDLVPADATLVEFSRSADPSES
jgi:3-methylcrotonyl-CoA carboxylase alpha subunit